MTTLPPFAFSLASVAVAEQRLRMKIAEIIAEIQSDTGLALRTLRTLMAAGMPPKHYGAQTGGWAKVFLDNDAPRWVADNEHRADALILKHGTAACAAAIGPDLAAFLLTLQGSQHG